MKCPKYNEIVALQGHESVLYRTERGYCQTPLYQHLMECADCNQERAENGLRTFSDTVKLWFRWFV